MTGATTAASGADKATAPPAFSMSTIPFGTFPGEVLMGDTEAPDNQPLPDRHALVRVMTLCNPETGTYHTTNLPRVVDITETVNKSLTLLQVETFSQLPIKLAQQR